MIKMSKLFHGVGKKQWPKETAGRKMTPLVPVIRPEQSIAEAQNILLKRYKELGEDKDIETINYFYVVNEEEKLKGVFSIKELFRQPPETLVKKVMKKTEIVKVSPWTDQERVAYLALKHNLKSVPVVDKNGVLLGIVPSDRILDILYKETSKDILQFAGIYHPEFGLDNALDVPVLESIKHRIPWLLIGLFGGILAAWIIGFFEASLKQNLILAMFIPVIVYMSNAVGSQTQTLFIRDLAIHQRLPFKKYLLKQLTTCFFIALVCSLLLFFIILLGWASAYLGFVLGLSMLAAIISATFFALFVPYCLNKLKSDPAFGSGPFATIIQDILSIIIYFSIANWLL